MKEKTRRILIMIVMAALIVSLMAASFAALTYGRYSGGRRDENSPYEDYIDFVGASAFEVSTPDEFVNAVENGYSYIKIADNAEEPFVINNDIADVYTNLVLDVNGTTVIRNSRNPVLDVRRSISVVLVYDSSVEGSGGFYNPVGSALQTSGGSLTVGSGVYESGPKSSVTSTLPTAGSAYLVTRTDRKSTYGSASQVTDLPLISEPAERAIGDVYLETTPTGYNSLITADTYLLYTEVKNAFVGKGETSGDATFKSGQLYINCEKFTVEGDTETTTYSADAFNPVCNVASCDFYYYYPVGAEGTKESPQTYAVVYGYNDVKGLAEDEDDNNDGIGEATALTNDGLVWPYAAIRSVRDGTVGGNTHARGGTFTTNFGTDNTYGILSVGGEMTVGTESATAPPTFTAVGEGTCIGMSAQTGDTLTIASGTFTSEVGDTILMRGGEMTVTGGTFTKSGNKARPSDGLEAIEASRTALIHMLGGELTIDGTVTGDETNPVYSVNMTAERPNNTPLTNVFGIYSAEDDTSGRATAGTVSVSGCSIAVHGTYSAGILSSAGTVNVGGTENGKADTDITVTNSIESNQLLTSSAVSSEGGEVNLNSTVNISSDSLGITARGEVNVMSGTTKVNTPNATGVYVNSGTLTVKNNATLTVDSAISNASYSWVTPPGTSEPTNAPNIYNGVYVQNGSLNSNGTLNVTFTGVQSDDVDMGNNSDLSYVSRWIDGSRVLVSDDVYRNFQVKSYAVRVEGSNQVDTEGNPIDKVTIAAGSITNSVGGGVLVNGGTVTLGAAVTDNDGTVTRSGPTVSATGPGYYNDTPYAPSDSTAQNWWYYVPSSGGEAVKTVGGTLTIHGGNYSAEQGNGILVNGGTSYINGGTFIGNDQYHTEGGSNPQAGPGASYAFKVLNGTANVYGGNFTIKEGGTGSGAFVTGSPASDSTAAIYATANIYGGSFVVSEGVSGGQAGFSVLKYANVTFETSDNDDIQVAGNAAGMTVEKTSGNSNATININGGTFKSTDPNRANSDGIWYGNGTTKVNIKAGQFTGANRSGLYFQENSWNATDNKGNVQIYRGTFIGVPDAEGLGSYYKNGAIGADSSRAGSGLGHEIQVSDFIVCSSDNTYASHIYYSNNSQSVGATSTAFSTIRTDQEDLDDNRFRDRYKINQTTCQYVRVDIA